MGVFRIGERAVVVADDALDAISPWAGDAQLEPEDLRDLLLRIRVE
jgi:hypothetical protein